MDHFPAFLALDARACLLVGAGPVAARKARLLLAAGADVTVVAPRLKDEIAGLVARGRLRHLARPFDEADVAGRWLVISATGDPATERRVSGAAEAAGIFCVAVDDARHSSCITPAVVDRSPLVIAISSGGRAPVLARRVRAQIERLLPARLGRLAELAGRLRQRVRTEIESARSRLRFWEALVDGAVADLTLAGRDDAAETAADALLDDFAGRRECASLGHAWLVGAGPGDPDLLTLGAFRALQSADVILYDRLVSDDVLKLARRDAELLFVGKSPGSSANRQEQVNELLVNLVREGKRVCRLKGGDPFVFGRGGEEMQALAAQGLPVTVIPGITAAQGCAAAAGIPLTHRDLAQSVVLATGHGRDSEDRLDWASLARDRQTLVFYMAVGRFRKLMQNLVAHGRRADTPVAIVERGTTADQRVVRGTLGQLTMLAEAHRIQAPAILVVGEVATMSNEQSRSPFPNLRLPAAAATGDVCGVGSATARAVRTKPV